ncbi:MAG: dynamin family protein [Pleurocapsa sp.]
MFIPPQCDRLADKVSQILGLVPASGIDCQNIRIVEASLAKAIAPKFEIVFAGAFSAGKSMLINALLERELLYSAEGHATGTECYIEYAEAEAERVVLTFLSEAEIKQQAISLCQHLGLSAKDNLTNPEIIELLQQGCAAIIEQEGGASKSDRAKTANALNLLLQGYQNNQSRIDSKRHNTYSMEEFNFSNLAEAASYARRGSNSAVLTKVEYYCHHPLLQDGNVLVDMPGIDAPVKKDAQLTYSKIEHPDTSAVICVLKPAAAGEMTSEETELLEKIKSNLGIRDRVFYVFNRIDQTWYNGQLRQRLDSLIETQFRDTQRVYKTSGLLGFYGSQIKSTNSGDRFGLDSIFAESVKGIGGEEETPQFVSEFNNYCANSGKLTRTHFRVSVNGYETPNENYTRILSEFGKPLIEQLITDSGIEEFRNAITRYLTEEKRPQLFANLEALYYLSNELEDTLVIGSQVLVTNFCQRLRDRTQHQEYYRDLDRLLREDTGILAQIDELETKLTHALVSEAKTECDRYVRESPRFYDEGTFSIYQFRQTLQQTSQGYDCESMVKAEPAICQLLKLDFEPKVSTTIRSNFRQTINQTIKTHLLPIARQQADKILQYYPQARKVLEQTLEQEAIAKIALNQKAKIELEEQIKLYNQSVTGINNCLRSLNLSDYQLPVIESM